MFEITVYGSTVVLIHLQSGGLRRSRMILLSRQGIAETEDMPFPFGGLPVQIALCVHMRGDV